MSVYLCLYVCVSLCCVLNICACIEICCSVQYVSSLWLSVCLFKCVNRRSVRSAHQLSVTDSSSVSGLERAAAAGTPRGDQQEAAGEKPRKTARVLNFS